MNKKILLLVLFFVFLISYTSATTVLVDLEGLGGNNSFSSIQDAINHSQKNDLIIISEGIYSENLVVDKQLKIQSTSGEEGDVTICSGSLQLPVIHVISDNVEIRGVTVTGENERVSSGIFLDDADNCLLINNKITNVTDGILGQHASDNIIQYNILSSNAFHGVHLLNSTDNYLEGNSIYKNERGVYLNYSDRNVLRNNNVYYNLHYGIALLGANGNDVKNNSLFLNEFGITLTNSDKNHIIDNNASYNQQYGFFLFQSNSNYLKNNDLAENNDSGVCIFVFSTNNTIVGNQILNNFNGVSIIASDNFIVNNTFVKNSNYGIFHLSSGHENTIEGNIFQDNPFENKKIEFWKEVVLFIFLFLLISLVSITFKISWLKKGLFGLFILMVVLVISLIVWYFPFESDLPGNNVYVEDLDINTNSINETHSVVTLSMNLNYLYKEAFSQENSRGQMIDDLPVGVQVISSKHINNISDFDEIKEVEHEEEIILEYLGKNPYECVLVLEDGMEYYLDVDVQMLDVWPYPRPSYGEMHWVSLGVLSEKVDLR